MEEWEEFKAASFGKAEEFWLVKREFLFFFVVDVS